MIGYVARDRRADRSMESRLNSVKNECTQSMRMLRSVFKRDRPTEGDAQDGGAFQGNRRMTIQLLVSKVD